MHLSTLKPSTPRKYGKVIGRGGKRGTTSGGGTKGQKSRAGASVRPGFTGGNKRPWQQFPKLRGASKKPGNKTPHRKHRFFSLKRFKPWEVNLRDLTVYKEGETVSPATLIEKGVVSAGADRVKILGTGELNRRLTFTDVAISAPARVKIERAGGTITP